MFVYNWLDTSEGEWKCHWKNKARVVYTHNLTNGVKFREDRQSPGIKRWGGGEHSWNSLSHKLIKDTCTSLILGHHRVTVQTWSRFLKISSQHFNPLSFLSLLLLFIILLCCKKIFLCIDCTLDLEKDVNLFGRGTNNDFCYQPRYFKRNPNYQAISTKHFKLFRVCYLILYCTVIDI